MSSVTESGIASRGPAVAKAAALAAAFALLALLAWAPAASAVPGVPAEPTTVYEEDFQNVPGPTPILRLDEYTGATGQTYTAAQPWLERCNGWVASFSQSVNPATQIADCETGGGLGQRWWNTTQQLSYAFGAFHGWADPAANYDVSAFTSSNPGAGLVEFETASNIPFSANDRFITFSVDVAAVNCHVSAPLLQFSLLDASAEATPVGSPINGCASPTVVTVPPIGAAGAGSVRVGTYASNGALLFTGSSVGVRMVNNNGSGSGNDHAFDNIQILDVTPTLDKSFSPATQYVGRPSTLTFTVTNTSELAAKEGWSFTDNLPAGLVVANPANASTTCPAGQVSAAAGGTAVTMQGNLNAEEVSCTVTVDVTSNQQGSFENCPANVTLSGLNPPACSTVTFVAPDVAIEKSSSQQVVPGEEATYSLKVTNNGPGTATNVVTSDPLPDAASFVSASAGCAESGGTVTCAIGSLAEGASQTFEVTVRVAGSAECDDLTNTATVTSETPDLEPGNDSSSVRDCEPRADLEITKSASSAQVAPNGQVMYTLVVRNKGPSDNRNVTVTDPLAPGLTLEAARASQGSCSTAGGAVSCQLGFLEAGGSAQVLVTVRVTASVGCIGNSAEAVGNGFDPNRDNNRRGARICVTPMPPPAGYDLMVTKKPNRKRISADGKVTYRIVVRNNGPATAAGVAVTDTFNRRGRVSSVKTTKGSCGKSLPMRCSLGDLASGERVTITVVLKPLATGCRQRNAASVTGEGTDTNPKNNLRGVNICVAPRLRVTKTADRSSVRAGGIVRYTIRVTNLSKRIAAERVRTCDRMPSGLAFLGAKPKAKLAKGVPCWVAARIGAGKSVVYRVTAKALGGASGRLRNVATARGAGGKARIATATVAVTPKVIKPTPVTG